MVTATGTVLDYDEALQAMGAIYRAAEDELREDLQDAVRLILTQRRGGSARFRAAQLRGILNRVRVIRAELDGAASLFVDDTMARIYADGMARADRLITAAGVALSGSASFTAVHVEALAVIAADTYDDLARATSHLDDAARRVIREAAKARVGVGAATGASVGRDTSALVRRLAERGVTGFVDAAGRGWRMSSYAEMVVRTKSAQAFNVGTVVRATEEGTDVFVIRDGETSGHAECLAFSGTRCTGAWALANPIQHPNCVRSFGPDPLHRGDVQHR